MPMFVLPLDDARTNLNTRSRITSKSPRKRKRSGSPSPLPPSASPTPAPEGATPPAASTNPQALPPDIVAQYRLAGLELDQPLPSSWFPAFPERALPDVPEKSRRRRDEDDEDNEADDEGSGRKREPRLRMQHLGVVTTVLHRCLLENDIPRATKAWAMILRTQFGGRGVELRTTGYWGIGAELLIRSGEASAIPENKIDDEDWDLAEHGEEIGGYARGKRWGSAHGLAKAKAYYERLILQHPYIRQHHDLINALDFWPAMLSCEIYGIQYEHQEALKQFEDPDKFDDDGVEDDNEVDMGDDPETYYASEQRKETARRRRKAERIFEGREEARIRALAASEALAVRMDALMALPPYSDSLLLLRIRGMLALYIGDLNLPYLPESDEGDDEEDEDTQEELHRDDPDLEYRMMMRQRRAEHARCQRKQEEEKERAKQLFRKIEKAGGSIEDVFSALSLDMDDKAVDEELYDEADDYN